MVKGVPVNSPRTRDTMMLGDVPICVINPPSSAPKAIGIRKRDGETLERRANWKAIGIMIASAPIFLTKAESTVTTPTSSRICARGAVMLGAKRCSSRLGDAGSRHPGAHQKRAADNDDDVVAEAAEGRVGRHDADGKGGEQRQYRHEIIAQSAPDERHHHCRDDADRQPLRECHDEPSPSRHHKRLEED